MAPQPKKTTSTSRMKRRRTHISATMPSLHACPQCRSPKLSHRACSTCGTYRGRDVIVVGRQRRSQTP
ncbi:MAG: 50S ribosomal protein L32 [Dehalococcoidia bacterium]